MTFCELTEVLVGYGFRVEEQSEVFLVYRNEQVTRMSAEVLKISLAEFLMLVRQAGDLLQSK